MSAAAASSSASYMPGAPPGSVANPPPPISTAEPRLRDGPPPPPKPSKLSDYFSSRNALGLEAAINADNFWQYSIHAGNDSTDFATDFSRFLTPQVSRNQVKYSSSTNREGDLVQRWDALSPHQDARTPEGRRGFFHWTMFPVVSTGVAGGKVTPMTYIMAYSSFALSERVCRHKPDYQPCNNLPSYYAHGQGQVAPMCYVDTKLMGAEAGSSVMKDIHMMASLYASITSSRPANGSYITFWPYFGSLDHKREASTLLQDGGTTILQATGDDHKQWQVGGASAGLACFFAIIGGPTMFYTGSLRYIQPNRTMDARNATRQALPQPESAQKQSALLIPSYGGQNGLIAASHVWSVDNGGESQFVAGTSTVMLMGDMISNVTQIPAKVAYIAYYNMWPMIIPNNTTWQRDMSYVLAHQHTKAVIKFWLGLTPGIYTQASADSGVMYQSMPTPIIMAQNTSDAMLLSSTVMAVRYLPDWKAMEANLNPKLLEAMYMRANGDYQAEVVLANRKLASDFVYNDANVPAKASDVQAIETISAFIMRRTKNKVTLRGAILRAASDWGKTLRLQFKVSRKRVAQLRASTDRVLKAAGLAPLKVTDASYVSGAWKIPVIGALIGDVSFEKRYREKIAAHIAEVQRRAAAQKARFTAKTPVQLADLTPDGYRPIWRGTEDAVQAPLPRSIAPTVKRSDDAALAAGVAADDNTSPVFVNDADDDDLLPDESDFEVARQETAAPYDHDTEQRRQADADAYNQSMLESVQDAKFTQQRRDQTAQQRKLNLEAQQQQQRDFEQHRQQRAREPFGDFPTTVAVAADQLGQLARDQRQSRPAHTDPVMDAEAARNAAARWMQLRGQEQGSRRNVQDAGVSISNEGQRRLGKVHKVEVEDGNVDGIFSTIADQSRHPGAVTLPNETLSDFGKRHRTTQDIRTQLDEDDDAAQPGLSASGGFGMNGTTLPRTIHGLVAPHAAAGQFEAGGSFDRVANAIRRGAAAQNAAGQFGAAGQFEASGTTKRSAAGQFGAAGKMKKNSAAAQFKASGKTKATKAPVKAKATASGKMSTKKKTKDQEMAELKKKLKAESQRAKAAESNVAQASGAMAQLNQNPLATYFGNS